MALSRDDGAGRRDRDQVGGRGVDRDQGPGAVSQGEGALPGGPGRGGAADVHIRARLSGAIGQLLGNLPQPKARFKADPIN